MLCREVSLCLHVSSSLWSTSTHDSTCDDAVLIWDRGKWGRCRIQGLAKILGSQPEVWYLGIQKSRYFYRNVVVGKGGMGWDCEQGCPSYWGRHSYVPLQRILPKASDHYLILENIWDIIHVLVTAPCSSVPTECSLTLRNEIGCFH